MKWRRKKTVALWLCSSDTSSEAHLKWRNETGLRSHEVRVKEINEGANWYEEIWEGSKKIYLKEPLIVSFFYPIRALRGSRTPLLIDLSVIWMSLAIIHKEERALTMCGRRNISIMKQNRCPSHMQPHLEERTRILLFWAINENMSLKWVWKLGQHTFILFN